jgi:hypothetical protein
MSHTTSIHDLPTDPTGRGGVSNSVDGNINLVANEIQSVDKASDSVPSINLDQSTINQIINGLQQASSTGITMLPSRDIPQSTLPITQDPNIQPNYIPPPSPTRVNYIEENDINDNIELNYYKKTIQEDRLDSLYNEIQIPLLLIILYFILQLPICRNTIFKYIPWLCNNDGNININGIIFTSILYGVIYYILSKVIIHINYY